ncbi:MAG: phytanoyl-CoA dioxygenase family protein [Actinomycetota bacterium]|nr:phytanoyl-CoA dioxygenase family protein [Actinomycetota bacterium]MDG2121537.1 phytanoyl-CoA dioxygenase family protein [Actinomycetota bacterium]
MVTVNLPLLKVPIVDYGEDEKEMAAYRDYGTQRALELDNRGPIRFTSDGQIDPQIIHSYDHHGFYVFTDVIATQELQDIESDIAEMLDRSPVTKDASTDRYGRPAIGNGLSARNISWVKPLSDPIGGTDASYGRHQVKMNEPIPPPQAPEYVVQLFLGSLQFSAACLRLYGHPQLLQIAEEINGPDFTPFNEAVWIKQPGLGGSVAWHQDGWTHWESEHLDNHTHGFNFMAQLYGCDATNGLWVVPGSHRQGKIDIKQKINEAGSDRLVDAVPLICEPGDVAITSRQAIHGSFANTSSKTRVTINFGFHRRSSVLGVEGGGVHNPVSVYDDAYIFERSKAIAWGIDARSQRYHQETRYVYQPFAGLEDHYRWNADTEKLLRDYNLQDIGI